MVTSNMVEHKFTWHHQLEMSTRASPTGICCFALATAPCTEQPISKSTSSAVAGMFPSSTSAVEARICAFTVQPHSCEGCSNYLFVCPLPWLKAMPWDQACFNRTTLCARAALPCPSGLLWLSALLLNFPTDLLSWWGLLSGERAVEDFSLVVGSLFDLESQGPPKYRPETPQPAYL